MKASWYAEALYGALNGKSESESKKILAQFSNVVLARGHKKLFHFIANELAKKNAIEKTNNEAVLITADSKSASKWSHAYDHYEKAGEIQKGMVRRDVIDETIIGGFQIRTKGALIDGSYKKPLVELYKSITS